MFASTRFLSRALVTNAAKRSTAPLTSLFGLPSRMFSSSTGVSGQAAGKSLFSAAPKRTFFTPAARNAARNSNHGSGSNGGQQQRGYSTSSDATGLFGLSRRTVMMLGAGAGLGLVLNAASGLVASEQVGGAGFDEVTRSRLMRTYGYVAAGLGVTAMSAVAMFRAGLPYKIANHPWIFLGVSLVGTIGASMALQMIPYENTLTKHAALVAFNSLIGATLCPLVVVGGPVLLNAAAATGVMVGGLSLLAAAAPSESFMYLHAPLAIGLGIVCAGSIGTLFFPASSMLHNLVLYGGLAVFGGFVVYDTQKITYVAKRAPAGTYDPINMSVGIYMDTINIFIRMVQIFSNGNNRR